MSTKNNSKANKLNVNLLKNELIIARTSFEIAKKYKELAQSNKESNADELAVLPFYIFASFSHLNHCLMSIRKVLFDNDSNTVKSLNRYFNSNISDTSLDASKKSFNELDKRYTEIKKDINTIVAHINKERSINSIFSIPEQKFTNIEILFNETVELFNTLPETKKGLLPEKYSAFSNVLFGFETMIALSQKNIEDKRRKKS